MHPQWNLKKFSLGNPCELSNTWFSADPNENLINLPQKRGLPDFVKSKQPDLIHQDNITQIFQNFERFSLFSNRSNSATFWAKKMFFFLNRSEIDWLCYHWATPAKMCIMPTKLVEFLGVGPWDWIEAVCWPPVLPPPLTAYKIF